MPIIFEDFFPDDIRVAVWKINEPESVLREHYSSIRSVPPLPYKSGIRRKQALAARLCLHYLIPESEGHYLRGSDGSPLVDSPDHHISISHAGLHAAVAASSGKIGIDLEVISEKPLKLLHRFCFSEEFDLLDFDLHGMVVKATIIWSFKEALFKLMDRKGWDFAKDFRLVEVRAETNFLRGFYLDRGSKKEVAGFFRFFDDSLFVLVHAC